MKSNYLLPHSFQRIGFGIFVISLILLIAFRFGLDNLKSINQNNHYIPSTILYLIVSVSEYFVAFSRERIEDELIQIIRYSSIQFAIIAGFLLYIIVQIILLFNPALLLNTSFYYLMIINPVTLFIIYIFIFKTRLYLSKRGMKNEE